ncbi:MAG: hypothetical protein JJ863_38220 [Deltaproteobacteria bacterium]|nr:hypothetical protein [Deltaproteobacteria bacterium]
MSDKPDSCTVCGTSIPDGASRCPGCGAVWGDANRCPHCNATAGIKTGLGGGYVCMACGKPREAKPGTTIFESASPFPIGGRQPVQAQAPGAPTSPSAAPPVVVPTPMAASPAAPRGKAAGLRFLGIMSIAGGVLAGAVGAALLPIGGIIAAAAIGAVGVGVGALSLRAASRSANEADRRTDTQRELALLRLAEQHDGVLTVTDAARGLGISIAEADAALTAMADGSRIWAEVTPDGFVQYTFREMQARQQGPRVRVEGTDDAPPTSEEEQALAELEEELRERKL